MSLVTLQPRPINIDLKKLLYDIHLSRRVHVYREDKIALSSVSSELRYVMRGLEATDPMWNILYGVTIFIDDLDKRVVEYEEQREIELEARRIETERMENERIEAENVRDLEEQRELDAEEEEVQA